MGENIVIGFVFCSFDKKGIYDCGIWTLPKGYHESIVSKSMVHINSFLFFFVTKA